MNTQRQYSDIVDDTKAENRRQEKAILKSDSFSSQSKNPLNGTAVYEVYPEGSSLQNNPLERAEVRSRTDSAAEIAAAL